MANPDRPHGFRPIGTISGEPLRTREYNVAAANAVIGIGDLVILTTAGVIDRASATATQIVGVAAQEKDASSGGTCLVYDDPHLLVEAQTDDGTGAATAAADLFGNADFVVTDAVSGISRMEIDEDSQAATSTLPLSSSRL